VGKTILIVDDFASFRGFVCEVFRGKGYETLCAGSGDDAFRILMEKAGQINAVLTDYHMPGGSGLDLLKKIKSTESVAKVPVVFLTSEANPEVIRTAEEAGLFAWINKPYRSEVLFTQIELAIGSKGEA
jgi:CheY-like chemotaxis protein